MNFANPSSRPILMVEDHDVDYELTVRSFQRLGVQAPLLRFTTVEETSHFLDETRTRLDRDNLPGVIILDLQLSDGYGSELLQRIKSDRLLRHIPVVIWSASTDPYVIATCYESGASGFICKASERRRMDEAVESFVHYWLNTVTLPPTIH